MKRIRFNNKKREFYVELINEQGESKILDKSKTGTDSLFEKHPDLLED